MHYFVGSLLVAAMWSWLLAAATLAMRRYRNDVLVARGQLPYRDCVFPHALAKAGTILGAAAIAVTLFCGGRWQGALTAAIVAPSLWFSVAIAAAVSQLFSRQRSAP